MSDYLRPTIIFLIVGMAWFAGAYGESVTIGHGSSVAASEGSSAEGILVSDGTITQSSVSSVGVIDDLNIDPWVKNTKGDYAEIGVTGTNVAGLSYSDNYFPVKDSVGVSDAVWAQQWIGASSADSLNAYSYASNAAGDEAKAEITIDHGSLSGYYNAAYAGPAPWLGMDRGAFVQQKADHATGNSILINTWAKNVLNDRAGSKTEISDGVLNGYSALAYAVKNTNGPGTARVQVNQLSVSAPYGSIGQSMSAIDHWGDTSQVAVKINGGNLYSYPYDVNIPAVAYSISDISRKTYASQSYDAETLGFGRGWRTSYSRDMKIPYQPLIMPVLLYGRVQPGEIEGTG